MEFGIEKCAMFIMKGGKGQITVEIELQNKKESKSLKKEKL